MARKQSKKRAVISSIITWVLCLAILLQTTMAWFTDTTTNTGNRVESGGMEVQLLRYDGEKYEDISDGNGDIFTTEGEAGERLNGVLWEPGKTEVVYLQVKNADNLAFNYNIILSVSNDSNNTAKLQDAFSYAIVAGDYSQTPFTGWKEITEHALAETGAVPEGTSTAAEKGALISGASDYFALAVHMDEDAGNDYQYQALTIDVKIVAKQMNHESDSFGNLYDDSSAYPSGIKIYPTVAGHGELIINGDFEKLSTVENEFETWTSNQTGVNSFVESQNTFSGEHSAKFTAMSGWTRQWIDVVPGATYQLTGYTYLLNSTSSALVKFEGFSRKELDNAYATQSEQVVFNKYPTIEDFELENKTLENGRWMQFSYLIEAAPGTEYFMFYVRGHLGTALFDNVSLRMIDEPEKLVVTTNSNFYYTTETTGIAYLTPNTGSYPDISQWTADCRILEGETVKWEKKGIDLSSGSTSVPFDLTNCTNKTDYIFETILYEGGAEKDRIEWKFSKKHDRPSGLNENGLYVEEDGTVFHPVMAYHMYTPEEIQECANDFGVNLFQLAHGWVVKYKTEPDRFKATLDAIRANDAKVVVSLYLNNLICSAPENQEAVKEYMHALLDGEWSGYKDLIIAWAIDDEPVGGNVSEDLLREAYEMVHEIDPTRPVYTIDQRERTYPTLIRNADVISLDNYPYGMFNAMEYIYDCVKYADGIADLSDKPITTLLQCWPWRSGAYMDGVQTLYCPSGNAVRNMIYQSFMGGATGYGFYGFDYPDTNDPTQPNMRDTAMAESIKEFAAKEQDIMFDYFVDKEYVTFNSNYNGATVRYVSFLKDGKIYMVVLNKQEFAAQTVSIPLTSNNGNVTISSYTAVGYAGGAEDIVTPVTTGTLDVTLEPAAAAVYVITPADAISAGDLQ